MKTAQPIIDKLLICPGQNGAFSQTIFSEEFSWMKKFCILIQMSLKSVPKSLIGNNPELV